MIKLWIEVMAILGRAIYRQKFYLRLGSSATRRFSAFFLIGLLEIVLAVVCLPFYIFVDHSKFPGLFAREGHPYTLFKKRKKISLITSPVVLAVLGVYAGLTGSVSASVLTWNGAGTAETCPTGENNWSCPANWVGEVVPVDTDIAVFDGTSSKNITIDTDTVIGGLEMNTGFTGIITQAANITINGNYTQSSGVFVGGSNMMSIHGDFVVSGSEFTAPTADMEIQGSMTLNADAKFNHNGGNLIFGGSSDSSIHSLNGSSLTVNNLTINKASPTVNFSVSGAPSFGLITVLGTLNLMQGNFKNDGAGIIESRGADNYDPNSTNFTGIVKWTIGDTGGISVFVPIAPQSSVLPVINCPAIAPSQPVEECKNSAPSVACTQAPPIKTSMNRQIKIQVRFKEQTEFGEFNDALNFTAEEYGNLTPESLRAMEKERIDAWVDMQKNPPPQVEPTEEQLIEEKQSVEAQLQQIEAKIEQVTE